MEAKQLKVGKDFRSGEFVNHSAHCFHQVFSGKEIVKAIHDKDMGKCNGGNNNE
jgi:hypothetical protein